MARDQKKGIRYAENMRISILRLTIERGEVDWLVGWMEGRKDGWMDGLGV